MTFSLSKGFVPKTSARDRIVYGGPNQGRGCVHVEDEVGGVAIQSPRRTTIWLSGRRSRSLP